MQLLFIEATQKILHVYSARIIYYMNKVYLLYLFCN